jgi:hypothetical protein
VKISSIKYQLVIWPPIYFDKTDDGMYRILLDPPRLFWHNWCYNKIFQFSACFLWIEIRKYSDEFIKMRGVKCD